MLFWQEKDINLIYLLPMSSAVLGTETAFKSTSEKTKYKYAKFTKGVFNWANPFQPSVRFHIETGPFSYRNQSIDLFCKSMDWLLYDNGPVSK